ncbi:MAG: DUF2845 domain-containing protein [Gammaproteobacteria bacterium]|jgi:hypothetical protein
MRNFFLPLIGLIAISTQAVADPGFRCGNNLLQSGVGTSRYLVLQKCGEPTYRDGYRWYYDRGEAFLTVLVFSDNGELSFSKDEYTWR